MLIAKHLSVKQVIVQRGNDSFVCFVYLLCWQVGICPCSIGLHCEPGGPREVCAHSITLQYQLHLVSVHIITVM